MKDKRAKAKQTVSILVMNHNWREIGGDIYYNLPASISRYTYIKIPRMELLPHGTKVLLF